MTDLLAELPKRWFDHVIIGEPDRCWNWTASVNTMGYPQARIKYGNRRVHRMIAEIAHGPFRGPVHHKCRNRRCLNPHHLVPTGNTREHFQHHLSTHCIRGHELSGENLYIAPDGERICRACKRVRRRGYA